METVNIPIRATYRITDSKPICISQDRVDVPVNTIADLIAPAFGLVEADNNGLSTSQET